MCKLQRSIYGLVEASRSWNIRFDEVIKVYGFIQTYGEACIYKKVTGSSVAFLILYVDDVLLIGMKEICPSGNNKVVIYISLYDDKCLLFMLELY